MKLCLVPASAGPSDRQQRLINELHGIADLLCFRKRLGQKIAGELHPNQRTSRLQRLHALAKLRKAFFHIPEIATCPTSQHPATSQPKRKRIFGGQSNRSFGNWISRSGVPTQNVRSRQKIKSVTEVMRMPQLFGEAHRVLANCQSAVDVSEQRGGECQISLRGKRGEGSVTRRIAKLE